MLEGSETIPNKKSFIERHPDLTEIPEGRFPATIGIALGSTSIKDHGSNVQSAFSVVSEYSSSPARSIVLYADDLSENGSSRANRKYLFNYIDGALSVRKGKFIKEGIRIVWRGDASALLSSTRERLEGLQDETSGGTELTLYVETDPEKTGTPKPDVLFRSEQTDEDVARQIAGDEAVLVSVGDTLSEIDDGKIDEAIKDFADQPE